MPMRKNKTKLDVVVSGHLLLRSPGGKQIEAVLLETHTLRLNVGGDDDKDVKDVKMAVMMMSMHFPPDCTTKRLEKYQVSRKPFPFKMRRRGSSPPKVTI